MELFILSFLLKLLITGALWWAMTRSASTRRLWGLLAAGWTVNLLGDVAWGVHDQLFETALPPLSWLDVLYVARYLLIGLAFWTYPTRWPHRHLWQVAGTMALAALIAWVAFYQPVLAATDRSWAYFAGLALYPILDAGLVYVAWIRYRRQDQNKKVLLVLFLSTISYSIANLINFGTRMASPGADSLLANLLWLGSDLLAGAALIY